MNNDDPTRRNATPIVPLPMPRTLTEDPLAELRAKADARVREQTLAAMIERKEQEREGRHVVDPAKNTQAEVDAWREEQKQECATLAKQLDKVSVDPAQRLTQVIGALQGLDIPDQLRVLKAAATYHGIEITITNWKRPTGPTPREPFPKSPT